MDGCGIITMVLVISVVINLILIIANKTYYQYPSRFFLQSNTGESSSESPYEETPIYHYRRMPPDDIEAPEEKIL